MKCYSSDVVRLVTDLAYLPRSQGRSIKFDEKSIFTHMLEMIKRDRDQSHQSILLATESIKLGKKPKID